jgi:Na+/H+ antiporter NhaD/arsenite permease-like protein
MENDDEKLNGEQEEKLQVEEDIEEIEERSELDKEKGKWFMDLSKFVLTAFIFATALQSIENIFVAYTVAIAAAVGLYLIGTRFFKKKKKKKKKNKKNKKKNTRNENNINNKI